MTEIEKLKIVAKACGYEVRINGRHGVDDVYRDGVCVGALCADFHPSQWNPLTNFNQAVECLNRVFDEWRHDTWVAENVRYHWVWDLKLNSDSGVCSTFGEAAVAAILSAKGGTR